MFPVMTTGTDPAATVTWGAISHPVIWTLNPWTVIAVSLAPTLHPVMATPREFAENATAPKNDEVINVLLLPPKLIALKPAVSIPMNFLGTAALDVAEKRVAVALKQLIKKFRFKDAVKAKGDNARIHVGVIAQEVIAAFQAEGLDPMGYSIVCHDEWDAEPEVKDDDGAVIFQAREAGDRYGIRYDELLAFIIAGL